LFNKKGVILIEKTDGVDEDSLMMESLEAGAEDFDAGDEYFEILTEPAEFTAVRGALEKKGYEIASAEIQMIPVTTTKLEDPKQIELMDKLIENLEDLDDVQNVWHNWEQEEE